MMFMTNANEIKLAVVDDAPFIREIVRHIVSQQSQIKLVAEAANGNEAISVAKEMEPDVILMDIVMPEKSGIDAAQEILALNPKIKIIACSTVDQESMILKALDAGCCSYLTKPFTPEQLTNLIFSSMQGGNENAE